MDITSEILNNREKYPDDQEITLVGGAKITVKEFRDQLQPRAEFTRASEGWKREKGQLEQAVTGLQGQMRQLEGQLADAVRERKPAAAAPDTSGGPSDEELLADPVLGRIVKRLNDTQTKLDQAVERVTSHEGRLKNHEETWVRRDYTTQLANIAAFHNNRFNKDGKGKAFNQQEFLDFAIQRGVADLEVAYRAFSHEDAVQTASREAEERGREAGRKEARTPAIPYGRRATPPRDPGLPATLQELTDEQILADPDIQAALQGESAG